MFQKFRLLEWAIINGVVEGYLVGDIDALNNPAVWIVAEFPNQVPNHKSQYRFRIGKVVLKLIPSKTSAAARGGNTNLRIFFIYPRKHVDRPEIDRHDIIVCTARSTQLGESFFEAVVIKRPFHVLGEGIQTLRLREIGGIFQIVDMAGPGGLADFAHRISAHRLEQL